MTTNKPEVVAWIWDYRGRHMATTDYSQALELAEPPYPTEVEPLIRLADYQRLQADHERLQAECEKLRKDAATERQIQRAAQHLPEGWRITVEVEKDAGWIDAFNPDGSRIEIDWIGSLAEQIEQAIDTAMQEAAHESH
ncbi:hypothetical protein SAMN05216578_102287 [Halopseudomonas formosensis]|uniref:Uncharacterized protein n=1 Tax=Halopseudomonas formosensis TaxID=1002526 RepID=A0A1I6APF5_9GAMM|nr:hypothetical protein [Halopseudomonas formosensis]SFQ70526.1 hypothetical protein SAMN05216578_102287 [Halopseudomonas formosensis]